MNFILTNSNIGLVRLEITVGRPFAEAPNDNDK